MAIRVDHLPQFGAVGPLALAAGQGQYGQHLDAMATQQQQMGIQLQEIAQRELLENLRQAGQDRRLGATIGADWTGLQARQQFTGDQAALDRSLREAEQQRQIEAQFGLADQRFAQEQALQQQRIAAQQQHQLLGLGAQHSSQVLGIAAGQQQQLMGAFLNEEAQRAQFGRQQFANEQQLNRTLFANMQQADLQTVQQQLGMIQQRQQEGFEFDPAQQARLAKLQQDQQQVEAQMSSGALSPFLGQQALLQLNRERAGIVPNTRTQTLAERVQAERVSDPELPGVVWTTDRDGRLRLNTYNPADATEQVNPSLFREARGFLEGGFPVPPALWQQVYGDLPQPPPRLPAEQQGPGPGPDRQAMTSMFTVAQRLQQQEQQFAPRGQAVRSVHDILYNDVAPLFGYIPQPGTPGGLVRIDQAGGGAAPQTAPAPAPSPAPAPAPPQPQAQALPQSPTGGIDYGQLRPGQLYAGVLDPRTGLRGPAVWTGTEWELR